MIVYGMYEILRENFFKESECKGRESLCIYIFSGILWFFVDLVVKVILWNVMVLR